MGECFLISLKLHKDKKNNGSNSSKHLLIIHYLPNPILSAHLISSFIPHNHPWLLFVITDCKSSTYPSTQIIFEKNK